MGAGQRPRRAGFAAGWVLAFAGAAMAQAPEPPVLQWNAAAGATQRRLFEESATGERLLAERGVMGRVELGASFAPANGPAFAAEAGWAAGRLDYDGQTQTGAPLQTASRHHDADLTLLWRPGPAGSWGEAWLLLQGARQHRDIESIGRVTGLVETSWLLMPGLRWRGPAEAARGWRLWPQVEARVSAYHRLEVDFNGLFDDARLDGGRRWALALGVDAQAPDAAWRLALRWTRARQVVSQTRTLYRNGAPVGTVRQPRLGYDDLTLTLRRDF
ncbi:hypothetical protein [Ramlibacter tataouinensis]|uniref:YaiO family outer membrane beta-barrel protein n=1 Tax=Ramlibacter tataouinensis (strain ATCC BAA-407 / DSM 14655 / LMG 21543 / TTB310) TaxID=365046 RepID=F5Y4P8_RAMTT|nr:hypothetical protein [Ramlibacter tataouinensis]AEG91366.1 Hypothetical protein Rta_02960 [Ramlibacter tataouinensis TTB310]